MKTIEEAAKDYVCSLDVKKSRSDTTYDRFDISNSFCEGIEFAQRWIPVEEELPEIGIDVLIKDNCCFYVCQLMEDNTWKDLYYCQFYPTHWRPIKLK